MDLVAAFAADAPKSAPKSTTTATIEATCFLLEIRVISLSTVSCSYLDVAIVAPRQDWVTRNDGG